MHAAEYIRCGKAALGETGSISASADGRGMRREAGAPHRGSRGFHGAQIFFQPVAHITILFRKRER